MPTITKRAAARRDLVEHFVLLAENAGLDTADQFLSNAEASFLELVHQPQMGSPLCLNHPDLAFLRKWRIRGFENYLIFYQPRPDGVCVIRVLYATRDWWAILALEE